MIDDTIGGRALFALDGIVEVPTRVWQAASAIFAANAKGTAQVFLRSPLRPGNFFMNIEAPVARIFGNPRILFR